jgi:hypothetical protein
MRAGGVSGISSQVPLLVAIDQLEVENAPHSQTMDYPRHGRSLVCLHRAKPRRYLVDDGAVQRRSARWCHRSDAAFTLTPPAARRPRRCPCPACPERWR